MNYLKLQKSFPLELRAKIIDANVIHHIRKSESHYSSSLNCNRGVWPNPKLDTLEELLPGITREAHLAIFGEDTDNLGKLTIYWSTGEIETRIPVHRDKVRLTTINTNLYGCSGLRTEFFTQSSGSMTEWKTIDREHTVKIDEFTMGASDVWLIDTTVLHSVPPEDLVTRDVAILTYSWYDTDPSHNFSSLSSKFS